MRGYHQSGLVAILLAFGIGQAAADQQPVSESAADNQQHPALAVERLGGKIVAIKIYDTDGTESAVIQPDGTVEITKGTPDETARRFFKVLSDYIGSCSKL